MTAPDRPAARRPPPSARPRRSRRLRRRPLLLGVLVVALVAAVVLVASWVRPSLEPGTSLALGEVHVGTAYAFDGLVCLGSGQVGATVRSVEVEQAEGSTTRLVQAPEGAPPTLGFPVRDAGGASLEGREVPAGELDCEARLLVVPEQQGQLRPGRVRVTFAYGPGGLLRRTASLEPAVTLDVTRTGPDPRLDGS
jgi:hypothetical protein